MSRADRRVVCANGLPMYGASRADARWQHFVSGYFRTEVPIRPGMTVLDVGANIGMFSAELLRRCGGDAELFAFEPAPQPHAFLERNVRELFPRAHAHVYCAAVGAKTGEATLYYRPRLSPTSSLYPGQLADPEALLDGVMREPPDEYRTRFSGPFRRLPGGLGKQLIRMAGRWSSAEVVEKPCTVTTVSDVIREHTIARVDFLKVDVEGAELDVLRGIDASDWPKIQHVAAEIHDLEGRVQTIREMLDAAGFERIEIEQEWPFEGTNVYMAHAGRASPSTA
jgi:FkbM family methyltransferase